MNPLEALAAGLRRAIAAPPGGADVIGAVRAQINRVPPPRPTKGGRRTHVLVTATQRGVSVKVFGGSPAYRSGLRAAVRSPEVGLAAQAAGRGRLGP